MHFKFFNKLFIFFFLCMVGLINIERIMADTLCESSNALHDVYYGQCNCIGENGNVPITISSSSPTVHSSCDSYCKTVRTNPMDPESTLYFGGTGSLNGLGKLCTYGTPNDDQTKCVYTSTTSTCDKEGFTPVSGGSNVETCDAGKYWSADEQKCVSCPAAYPSSLRGASSIYACYQHCPAGMYYPANGGRGCVSCNKGTYIGENDSHYGSGSTCSACPNGGTTSGTGATSASECYISISCSAGYYIPISGTSCNVACPDGAYCPGGDYTPSETTTVGLIYCARVNSQWTKSKLPRTQRSDCYDPSSTDPGSNSGQDGPSATYTVTADANGGTIKTPITTGWTMISNSDNKKATKDVSSGSTYGTLPEVTKTDDTLKEWNTKADGTGTKVTSSTTASETAIIYAIWNSTATTITGITISPKPAEVEVGKTIQLTAVVTPSTANQTVNWSVSNPEIATIDNNTGVVTGKVIGTVTITATTQDGTKSDTAQVTVKAEGSGTTTHNITFNCNGGTGTMESKSVNFGQTITLPTNSCARIGYTFSGWNTSSNGGGTAYADGATIDYTLNDNLELFAQWTRNSNTYLIHYDKNGGTTGTMTDTVATVDVEGTLKANTFKYSGHTFDGWKAYYKDSNGNWTPLKKDNKEVELKNKAKFTNLMGPNEEEVTLFAQWKVVNPKTGIVTPTAIIGGLLLISALGYYLVKKKNIVLE